MERSVIRVRSTSFTVHPGFHFVQPELRNSLRLASGNKKKGSGTPADAVFHARTQRRAGRATETAACAAASAIGRARLPAFHPRHLQQRPTATAQLQFTHFLGRSYGRTGVIRPRPSQCSGRCSPQAGRHAGRAFFTRSRPGADCKSARGNRTRPTCRFASARRPFWARWRLKRFAGMVVKRATVRVRRGEESRH